MATARLTTKPVRTLFIAVAAALLVVIPVTAGHADPKPTVAQANKQVAELQVKMERATEEYDKARTELKQSQQRADSLRTQAAEQQKLVDRFRHQVAEFAASAYRGGNISQFTSLLDTGSPQNFLDQVTTLDQISKSQREQLELLVSAEDTLREQQQQIEAEVATQKKKEATLAKQKTAIEKDLAKWRELAEQAQLEVQARAEAAGRATRGSSRQSIVATYNGPASGAAAAAVRFAYAQLGKPYSWGADGPSAYDCSGLTMAAWGAAGVGLPHSSQMQYSSGRRVSTSNLRAGDLVFFGSPIHHVGIYIGGGKMIHAPVPGDVVKISSISIMPLAGAVRP